MISMKKRLLIRTCYMSYNTQGESALGRKEHYNTQGESAFQYTGRKCISIHREKVHHNTQGESALWRKEHYNTQGEIALKYTGRKCITIHREKALKHLWNMASQRFSFDPEGIT